MSFFLLSPTTTRNDEIDYDNFFLLRFAISFFVVVVAVNFKAYENQFPWFIFKQQIK